MTSGPGSPRRLRSRLGGHHPSALPGEKDTVRRLAILKIWADVNGLDGHWPPVAAAGPFDPGRWLRLGREWDDESIGLLAHPPPPTAELEADLVRLWAPLGTLDEVESVVAAGREADRSLVVTTIAGLPQVALTADDLWRP